ncbi:molecular chaperone [Salarchaeum sp. JOR-1]|uniref:TorD/DmsD family molecular chaperone n=1 Tax=Salarchaeum sp. JOR-1 TaxID=2599399 RepID=UPI0011986D5A|nr:molecular chaperone TorD family protein [Salarchaeum sp. JOR-1]QDX41400.1 molecular chaperone TorD family protein [Salarchaeum sp. JOR-1]
MTTDVEIYDARIELIDYCIDALWDTPDESFLETIVAGEIGLPEDSVNDRLDAGFEHLRAFREQNADADVDSLHDRLNREYTSLFVGPRPPIQPHETYFREDTEFIGQGLAEVEASYSAAGWTPPEDYGEENDHAAVELAFLRYLVARQRAGVEEAFGYERVFLDEHLTTWVGDFADAVTEESAEPFYLAAANVFAGLVAFEDEIVAQMT